MKQPKLIPVKLIPNILPVSLPTVRSWVFQEKLPESSITLSFSDIVNLPEKTVSKVGKLIGTHFEIKNIPLFKYSVESEFANFFKSYLKNSRVYKEPQSHTISI